MRGARTRAEDDARAIAWVCRHGRQSIAEMEAMYVSKFIRLHRHLIDIVSDEWSPSPGE